MGLLLRGLVPLLIIGMMVFCLIDCVQTPEFGVRNLPKWAWIVLILLFDVIGCIAWLVAGRPTATGRQREYTTGYPEHDRQRPRRGVAPDDDPEFLHELGRVNTEHERTLGTWEADLRRREEELRRREEQPPTAE